MKVLVILSCALAIASAGYEAAYPKYHGPLAVLGPNGVPLETPEVVAAKAHHLAALSSAGGAAPYAYAAPAAYPGVAPSGVPLDTPEVAAAKADHFAAFNKEAIRNGAYAAPYYAAAAPVYAAAGPVDTPEVEHAKAAHFAAHAEALARSSPFGHYRRKRSLYSGPVHYPVINEKGVPVDTPEVQAAKAYHFSAYQEAAQKSALAGPGDSGEYYDNGNYEGDYSEKKYYGPIHIPVIGPNGVPVDTPEVQHARAAHLAALSGHASPYAAAPSPYYAAPYGYAALGHDGQPLETPEVKAAKAAHFAAHAAARHYY